MPAPTPPVPPSPDELLESKLDETARLAAATKIRYAQSLVQGGDPNVAALVAIDKLETKNANMSSFLRLRKLHRARRGRP
ncbi:MAG TPA: hypothetical protein VG265_13360 [Gaiellaceae bacterium]|jgi:hypothetical protein|nr:hypothetical protein [Gaiellaceae bacterium]